MEKLIVSTSPHIRCKDTTQRIMLDMLIALSPATVAAVVLFGLKALLMVAVCVGAAVGAELLFNLITKKKQTASDLSAAVTGLLLALNLPTTTSIYQCILGALFAIVVVKCLFGGIGCNFANPAITARVFLLVSFTGSVAGGVAPSLSTLQAGATPLEAIKTGATDKLPSLLDMLIGLRGGAIGEVCAIALLIGFVYLVVRKVIAWYVPATMVATVFVLSLILLGDFTLAVYQVLGGSLLIGAIFMATDYSTTPLNKWGKVVFAFGAGALTVLIRNFGGYPEGVSFAILIMNILSPYIEKWCAPRPFGGVKA